MQTAMQDAQPKQEERSYQQKKSLHSGILGISNQTTPGYY